MSCREKPIIDLGKQLRGNRASQSGYIQCRCVYSGWPRARRTGDRSGAICHELPKRDFECIPGFFCRGIWFDPAVKKSINPGETLDKYQFPFLIKIKVSTISSG